MEDEVLTATGGTWTGPGTITKAIFWQRCNTAGEGCATVVGATGATYRLTVADVGTRLRVIETASNEGGTAQAASTPTAVVDELRPTASRPTVPASKVNCRIAWWWTSSSRSRRATRSRSGFRSRTTRGFRVSGILVRGRRRRVSSRARPPRERRAWPKGWATFVFRATGAGTTYVFAEARREGREGRRAGMSSARTSSGCGSARRLVVGGFLPKHVVNLKCALSALGQEGRSLSEKEPPFVCVLASSLYRCRPVASTLAAARSRARASPRRHRHRRSASITGSPRSGQELTAHNGTWLYADGAPVPRSESTMTLPVAETTRTAARPDDQRRLQRASTTVQSADAGHAAARRWRRCPPCYDCRCLRTTRAGHDECNDGTAQRACQATPRSSPAAHAPTSPTTPHDSAAPTGPKPQAPLAPRRPRRRRSAGVAMVEQTLTATHGNVERLRSADDRARVASL